MGEIRLEIAHAQISEGNAGIVLHCRNNEAELRVPDQLNMGVDEGGVAKRRRTATAAPERRELFDFNQPKQVRDATRGGGEKSCRAIKYT